MNAIEQAHQRYERNKAARERQALKAQEPVVEVEAPAAVEVPKERPMADAVIRVTVELPTGVLAFVLTKKDVLSNVPNGLLNQREFRKHIVDGLKPLLGDVT